MKILFISHEASRTGAPLVLLSILKELSSINDIIFDVLLLNSGDLNDIFKQLSRKVFILDKTNFSLFLEKTIYFIINNFKNKTIQLIFGKLHSLLQTITNHLLFNKLKKQNYSLIYANSICSAEFAAHLLKYLPISSILHVHELEYSIDLFVGHDVFQGIASSFDRFIAVSEMVKNDLKNYHINDDIISVIYPFSPNIFLPTQEKMHILNELGINNSSFIIGSSGTVSWVKGYDIFISLAFRFFQKFPNSDCVFVWIGKILDNDKNILYDLKNANLVEKVKFIGERENPIDYYNTFDVFTIVSRVDSFSLVGLENAFLSKPLFCFNTLGFMSDFIGNDSGFVIPYLDIDKMCDKIHILYKNQALKEKLGINAKNKYFNKYSANLSFNQLSNLLKRFNP
jgi:glycosyltransferase involved in cell wall biosynthesis